MILEEINSLLRQGRAPKVKELVAQALSEGIKPQNILDEGLLAAMSIVGDKFKNNEIYVPEVMIAARAMNAGIEILKPYLSAEGVNKKGTVVIGTVKGDQHDIGKNLVKLMMEGKGLNVIDLGVDVSPSKYLESAKQNDAKIIACSALLTTTMPQMQEVVNLVKAQGFNAKVMVGGAPVTQEFCDKIGADCYTADAASAADEAISLIEQMA